MIYIAQEAEWLLKLQCFGYVKKIFPINYSYSNFIFSCSICAKNITCPFNGEAQIITFAGGFMQIMQNNGWVLWIWYSGLTHSHYESHSLRNFPSVYWTNPSANAALISDFHTNHTSMKISLSLKCHLEVYKKLH